MKRGIGLLIGLCFLLGFGFADYPDEFLVEVTPSTFEVNEPVDLSITAMKNGKILKNVEGDFSISIGSPGELKPQDYVVPNNGWFFFLPQDQGKMTFSKGLEIKKGGTYKVGIYEGIDDEKLLGYATVTVGKEEAPKTLKAITVYSPQSNFEVKEQTVNVLATSPELPNSLVQIFLNGTLVKEAKTNANGDINEFLSGVNSGQNTVELKIVSLNGEVLGKSDVIPFKYAPMIDEIFKGIVVTPTTGVKLGDKVNFEISTDSLVSSAQIFLFATGATGGVQFPLDNLGNGSFQKQVMMTSTGEIIVHLELMMNGNKRFYENVAIITVGEAPMIHNVRMFIDPQKTSALKVSWEVVGENPTSFVIKHGESKDALSETLTSTVAEIVIDPINLKKSHFFQITPVQQSNQHGAASEIYEYIPPMEGTTQTGDVIINPSVETCVVKGIQTQTEKIGNKYYLVWSDVANVDKYIVYRSDFEDGTNRQKVAETTLTRYEYPFDRTSKVDEYAYYTIEAVCKDGKTYEITSTKKVQVGPTENIIIVVCIALFLYAGFRLYRYAK